MFRVNYNSNIGLWLYYQNFCNVVSLSLHLSMRAHIALHELLEVIPCQEPLKPQPRYPVVGKIIRGETAKTITDEKFYLFHLTSI